MARTATLTYNATFTVQEAADTTTSPNSPTGGNFRVFDQAKLQTSLSSSGTPALSGDTIDLSFTLAAADTDFDLTAAPPARDVAETVDMTGKKLVAWSILADSGNAGNITIKPHPTTNPYNLFGASGLLVLGPGRHAMSALTSGEAAETDAVSGTAKSVRVSGTSGDSVKIILVFA